jgi:hypothetical protein
MSGLILTHTSSSTRVVFKTKVVYQAIFFPVHTGRIPSWTYSKADVYRGTTVYHFPYMHHELTTQSQHRYFAKYPKPTRRIAALSSDGGQALAVAPGCRKPKKQLQTEPGHGD